tara:strand:- start:669 stop:1088 length:420 start_codon:yes stop_codon:yes gene_type:complete
MKTESIKKKDICRDWYLVDAKDKTLGRLSSKVATILRGKNKVNYTPNIDASDFVVIINADKIKVTGNKEDKKAYWRHSGFPGGTKTKLYKTLDSTFVIIKAIKGMLPHNRLGRKLINHLKVYNGESHPHKSQNPKLMEI